jgi:hypothetical protein
VARLGRGQALALSRRAELLQQLSPALLGLRVVSLVHQATQRLDAAARTGSSRAVCGIRSLGRARERRTGDQDHRRDGERESCSWAHREGTADGTGAVAVGGRPFPEP